MDSNDSITSLTERKVVRRGLLAGLASLGGAALLKVAGGAKHVEAAPTALLIPGAPGDDQTLPISYAVTDWLAGTPFSGSAVLVIDARHNNGDLIDGIDAYGKGRGRAGVFGAGGQGASSSGYGVDGVGGDATGSFDGSPGVHGFGGAGLGTGNGGTGVQGFAGAGNNSRIQGFGVQGTSGNSKGVLGQSSSGDGVHGASTTGVGLRGTSPAFVGLVGISDQSIGLYGYTVAPSVPAFYAENLGPYNRVAGLFNGDVQVIGNFTVSGGAKAAAVKMPDGSEATMYCQEAPEPYFEDFGRSRLVNGVAQVQLEPEFASLAKRDDYMVFPVPEGELKSPLFISQKSATGFEVREANGGTSTIPFTYRIVAKRKDIEGKRLARLDPQVKANIAQMRSAAAAKNHPSVKVPPGGNPLVPLEAIPQLPQPPAARPER